MGNHKKKYTDYSEFLKATAEMRKFQKVHNIIREDYMVLIDITEKHKSNKHEFDSLYRACLKGLFSIIEADVFGLNNLDEYKGYTDKHSFEKSLKTLLNRFVKLGTKKNFKQNILTKSTRT